MSDITVTLKNLNDLFAGKTDFKGFEDGELAMFQENIASLDAAVQPSVQLAFDALKAGASALVGAGVTALGPVLAESTDEQATQVLNILSGLGIKAGGALSIAEHTVVTTIINGLKAGLDHIGVKIATSGTVTVEDAAAGAGAQ